MQRSYLLAVGVALSVAASDAMSATAQAAGDYETPKTSWGKPDINGTWTNVTLTPLIRKSEYGERLVFTPEEVAKIEGDVQVEIFEANLKTDPDADAEFEHETTVAERPEFAAGGGAVGGYNRFWLDPGNVFMRVNGEPRTSILTTPSGQIPSRKAGAPTYPRPDRSRGDTDSYEVRSLGDRCIIGFGRNGGPPMLPNGFYNNNYEIVQTPTTVMIEIEMNHDARIIRIDSEHRKDGVRPYFGDSIAHWDGDTLVVETVNIPQIQNFMGSWEDLKVTERFTRVDEHRLHYVFEVEDPAFWDKPWGGEYEFSTLDGKIYEYACHEGNYALPGILRGGRIEDAEKVAAKK